MKVFLIIWASLVTVALVCSLVIWHPWNQLTPAVTDNTSYSVGYEEGYEDGYKCGYKYGYNAGSLPEIIAGQESLLNSEVVYSVAINVGVSLRGLLLQVSFTDWTIVLGADGDNRTVYLTKDTKMVRVSEEEETTEFVAIDMEEIESNYLGKQITVIALLKEGRFEGDTVFLADVDIKLR